MTLTMTSRTLFLLIGGDGPVREVQTTRQRKRGHQKATSQYAQTTALSNVRRGDDRIRIADSAR